ncbi:DUF4127 family protein, partial [Peptococcaceae bacterium]|nr:DUF4127 family protein [Peptococcaceae bacterium]
KKIIITTFCLSMVIAAITLVVMAILADNKVKVLYVPLDERPVNLSTVTEIFNNVPVELLTPPSQYLPVQAQPGSTEKLWQWVFDNCHNADYVVLSADTMIYGGLTASRLHHLERDQLAERVDNFKRIKEINPEIEVYVFSTVMRTPRIGGSTAELGYYRIFGSKIFRVTALQDQKNQTGLSLLQEKEKERLLKLIPDIIMEDWLQRREKNLAVNAKLINLVDIDVIDFFILGRDDTAVYSQSSQEWRVLQELAVDLPVSRFISLAGADEVGLLLLTRAVNHQSREIPAVYVRFAPGVGKNTIPLYEDQAVWKNIRNHIYATRCRWVNNAAKADLILAINTPLDGVTGEAGKPDNLVKNDPAVNALAKAIDQDIESGLLVAVADISFANGADNDFMAALHYHKLLSTITAYAGWNTAGNSIGYALGQGVLSRYMSALEVEQILVGRLLDDWGYQANVRREINRGIIQDLTINRNNLGQYVDLVQHQTQKKIRYFAENKLTCFDIKELKVTFPWQRTFDIDLEVKMQCIASLQAKE